MRAKVIKETVILKGKYPLIILVILLTGLPVLFLEKKEKPVQWCHAIAGNVFYRDASAPVTIVFKDIESPAILSVDMHGISLDGTYIGYVGPGCRVPLSTAAGNISFDLRPPVRKDLSDILLVLYISRDGSWKDRYRYAVTKAIPLVNNYHSSEKHVLTEHLFFSGERKIEEFAGTGNEYHNSLLKTINSILLVCIISIALINGYKTSSIPGDDACVFQRKFWRTIALLMFCIGLLSIPQLRSAITELARFASRLDGWYEERRYLQRIMAFLIVVGTVGMAGFYIKKIRGRHYSYHIILSGAGVLTVITLLRLLSYHYLDVIFHAHIAGLRIWLLLASTALTGMIAGGILQGFGRTKRTVS